MFEGGGDDQQDAVGGQLKAPLLSKSVEPNDDLMTAADDSQARSAVGKPGGNRLWAGTVPLAKSWWIQRRLFTWMTPLVDYVNGSDQITAACYGDLRECDRVEIYIERLRKVWMEKAA